MERKVETLIPVGRHVLVFPDAPVQKIGHIIVPESYWSRPAHGKVASVSNDCEFQVAPGDFVMHEPNAGTMIGSLLVIHEDRIIFKR